MLAGAALVAIGIVCLYLSDAVADKGSWWQGTLDAFGVGFIVGGIVDVTAISLLNQILTGSTGEKRRAGDRLAGLLLNPPGRALSPPPLDSYYATVDAFMQEHGDEIDPLLRVRLLDLKQQLGYRLADARQGTKKATDSRVERGGDR